MLSSICLRPQYVFSIRIMNRKHDPVFFCMFMLCLYVSAEMENPLPGDALLICQIHITILAKVSKSANFHIHDIVK